MQKSFDITIFIVDFNLENPQLKCYEDAYKKFGNEVDWMAFIDGDEFIFPTHDDSMEIALAEFSNEKISAIGVYWSCFGSSGYVEEPTGLIIENYKWRALDGYENNRHIKTIIRGSQDGVLVASPHFFKTPFGTYDENLRKIKKGWTDYEPTYKKFRINHYVTQSRSFFENFKSKVMPPDGALMRDESFWKEHNKNDVLDNSMDRFIVSLKKLLNN